MNNKYFLHKMEKEKAHSNPGVDGICYNVFFHNIFYNIFLYNINSCTCNFFPQKTVYKFSYKLMKLPRGFAC